MHVQATLVEKQAAYRTGKQNMDVLRGFTPDAAYQVSIISS